jgi:hypothetical protein
VGASTGAILAPRVRKISRRHPIRPAIPDPLLHREQLSDAAKRTKLFQIIRKLFSFRHAESRFCFLSCNINAPPSRLQQT